MKQLKLIVFVLTAICLLAVPLALGQRENPPASTKPQSNSKASRVWAIRSDSCTTRVFRCFDGSRRTIVALERPSPASTGYSTGRLRHARNFALRARAFRAISSSSGGIGRRVKRSTTVRAPQMQVGILGGHWQRDRKSVV